MLGFARRDRTMPTDATKHRLPLLHARDRQPALDRLDRDAVARPRDDIDLGLDRRRLVAQQRESEVACVARQIAVAVAERAEVEPGKLRTPASEDVAKCQQRGITSLERAAAQC